MPTQHTTGLHPKQYATLLTPLLSATTTWNPPATKPHKITLTDALTMTLIYLRHNSTKHYLADRFNIHQSTVSRTINTIEKALTTVLKSYVPPLESAFIHPGSVVVDGTLIPVWNWRSQGRKLYSGKHKRTGYNHQVLCTLEGRLLAITDPIEGARHDAFAFREHRLDQLLDLSSTLGDKGYVGLGILTPVKKPVGGRLSKEQKVVNRVLNAKRSVVERVIAQIKTWRVLHTGFRRPLGVYGRVFSSGAGVGVFWVGDPLCIILNLLRN
ncbi:MAG: transposase family protein [Rothia sp. (in: high G+C Gram-positive bacteria)]|nr:transposase family protein [Rothia sp. (in: high G+C Gram-positive bacteria)]